MAKTERLLDLPAVSLGDRGFLEKYGSKLTDSEISTAMQTAVENGLGIAAGDERTLRCARSVASIGSFLTFHIPSLTASVNHSFDAKRTLSTLHRLVSSTSSEFAKRDPLIGKICGRYADLPPFDGIEIEAMELDSSVIKRHVALIDEFRPQFVTVGGDWLDCAFFLGRTDLVAESLGLIGDACHRNFSTLGVLTYCGATLFSPNSLASYAESLVIPFNLPGIGMFPTQSKALSWALRSKMSLVGIHTTGMQTVSVIQALTFLKEYQVAAIVGASKRCHLENLISAYTAVHLGKA